MVFTVKAVVKKICNTQLEKTCNIIKGITNYSVTLHSTIQYNTVNKRLKKSKTFESDIINRWSQVFIGAKDFNWNIIGEKQFQF